MSTKPFEHTPNHGSTERLEYTQSQPIAHLTNDGLSSTAHHLPRAASYFEIEVESGTLLYTWNHSATDAADDSVDVPSDPTDANHATSSSVTRQVIPNHNKVLVVMAKNAEACEYKVFAGYA